MKTILHLCLLCLAWVSISANAAERNFGVEKTKDNHVSQVAQSIANIEANKTEGGNRYALVIGNANYSRVPALSNPVNDSKDICVALKKLRFNTTCMENLSTRRAMRDAVTAFTTKIKPEDVALFYFAGHGIEADGENYLIPIDAEIQSKNYLEDEALRVNFIFDELAAANARLSVILLDACRNNPFKKVRGVAGKGLAIPTAMPAGSIIIFPTSPGSTAMDGEGRNGLFTTHLLKHIDAPGIPIEEMFKRVISGVVDDAKKMRGEQIPWMNLSFTGEFCFVGCGTRVNTEEYLAVLKEKEETKKATEALKNELDTRQGELQQFRQRMVVLQGQLDEQKNNQKISHEELARLNREREELASKTALLQTQEEELKRARNELAQWTVRQAEFAKREQEMTQAAARIATLENAISLQEKSISNRSELDALKREREELIRRNVALQALQAEADTARQELQNVKAKLVEFDRQRKELDEYKIKMAQLEKENRQKDESFRQMRAELEIRQAELKDFKDRMAALQIQLDAQKGNQHASKTDLARLAEERDELARKAQQLEARETELKAAREQLARLEQTRAIADQREQKMAGYAERIAQLEAELARKNTAGLSRQELDTLKKEHEELLKRNAELQRQQPDTGRAQKELADLNKRLQEYDKQKTELDDYKKQLLALEMQQSKILGELKETKEQLKDAATSTVRKAAIVPPAM